MKSKFLALPLLALTLSGCAWLAPNYKRPTLGVPVQWNGADKGAGDNRQKLQGWWKEYHDPVLEKLIGEALANNADMALAGARLKQAKAQYDFSSSNRLPMLSETGIATRTGLKVKSNPLLPSKPFNISFVGGLLSYELDLWGKQASANKAAKASFLSAIYAQDASRLSIASATAQLYFNILALDADIKITKDTIASRKESYQIIKKQYNHEVVSGLVLRQSEAEWDETRAQLPQLIEQKDKAESSLAVMLGYSPKEIMEASIPRGTDFDALPIPPLFPTDAPSSLLERRPDIASTEQTLIASNFNIGMARAAYFPTISLWSLLGVSNFDIINVYNGSARTWQLGALMAGPLIDFGRTKSGVDLAKAKNQEGLESYKSTVRTAFKEVKDALSEQVNSNVAEKALDDEEKALKEALRLANLRYTSGYSSYIEVLDAERNLFRSQLAVIASKLNRLNASVNLYKALGGGWERNHKLQASQIP